MLVFNHIFWRQIASLSLVLFLTHEILHVVLSVVAHHPLSVGNDSSFPVGSTPCLSTPCWRIKNVGAPPVHCHCLEGRGREGVGSLVVQLPGRWRMRGKTQEDAGKIVKAKRRQ